MKHAYYGFAFLLLIAFPVHSAEPSITKLDSVPIFDDVAGPYTKKSEGGTVLYKTPWGYLPKDRAISMTQDFLSRMNKAEPNSVKIGKDNCVLYRMSSGWVTGSEMNRIANGDSTQADSTYRKNHPQSKGKAYANNPPSRTPSPASSTSPPAKISSPTLTYNSPAPSYHATHPPTTYRDSRSGQAIDSNRYIIRETPNNPNADGVYWKNKKP